MKFKFSFLALGLSALVLAGCTGGINNGAPAEPLSMELPTGQMFADYSATAEADAMGEPYALFFHSQSCVTCRRNEKKFKEDLATMPASTVLLKVNYDTMSTEMKQKYGVTKYDSIAYVNADGTFETVKGVKPADVRAFFADGNTAEPATEENKGITVESVAGGVTVTADVLPSAETNTTTGATETEQGVYTAYSAEAIADVKAMNKPYVLFFHASWCPPCRAVDADLKAGLADMPANTLVFKVDYDSETELKQQYEVRTQHTAVFIDSNGEMVDSITGFDMDDLQKFFVSV